MPDVSYTARYTDAASLYALAQGTSIDFALAAISAVAGKPGRLLDVGCGPGLIIDFWERIGLGAAVGIEPSSTGSFALDELHRNIRVLHLAEDAQVRDTVYDIVLSTEVVEHVADPALFLRELSARVAPEGVLIFTTPDIGTLAANQAPPHHLVEALSPGFHVTLFSEKALRALMAEIDWPYVELIKHNGHWIVYASRIRLQPKIDPAWVDRTHREYLERAAGDDGLSPYAKGIFNYRLFRKVANEGDWVKADTLLPRLTALLPAQVMHWTLHPETVAEGDALSDDTLQSWVAEFYHLPAYLYLMGIRCKNHLGKIADSIHFFKIAGRLARLMVCHYLNDAYTKEIFWSARLNEGIALIEAGKEEEGMEILEQVGISMQATSLEVQSMLPQLKFATRARLEIFQQKALRGKWTEAAIALPPLQGFLATYFPQSLLRISAWMDARLTWPEGWNPFWYFYAEQMLLLHTGHLAEAAEGFAQLHGLCLAKVPHPEAAHFLELSRTQANVARKKMVQAKSFFPRLLAWLRRV